MISYVELDPPISLTKTTTAFETFDLSASIPAGATFAVTRIENTTSTGRRFGYRAVGDTAPQTTSISGALNGRMYRYYYIPLSSSRQIEIDVSDTGVTITVLAYLNANASKVNYANIAIQTANVWQTVNVASYGTPKAAILLLNGSEVGFAKYGTAQTFFSNTASQAKQSLIVPLSDDYKFNVYCTTTTANVVNIIGMINKGFISYEPVDKTPASIDTWTPLSNPTNAYTPTANAILYTMLDIGSGTQSYGFRKGGNTVNAMGRAYRLESVVMAANSTGVVEANVTNTNYKVYDLGYFANVEPIIASVSGGGTIAADQSVTVSGLELISGNSATLTTNTKTMTMNNYVVGDTTLQFDVPDISHFISNGIRFNSAKLSILNSSLQPIANIDLTVVPSDGFSYLPVTDVSKTNIASCIFNSQTPAIANGDQVLYETKGETVTIDYQGFPTVSSGVQNFSYRFWDATDETWGSLGQYYVYYSVQNLNLQIVNSPDGNRYSKYPTGNNIIAPYSVYPVEIGGLFDGATIPNTSAKWRVLTARSASKWEWYDGGGYTFDATNAAAGNYVAIYEVRDWDGQGNNATASVTVTVS